jgi:hypothetical protein
LNVRNRKETWKRRRQEKEKKKHPHTEFSFEKTYEKTGVAGLL